MNNEISSNISSKHVPQANVASSCIAAEVPAIKKRKQLRLKLLIACGVMILGLAMVIFSLILAARNYPWAILFRTAGQDAQELPDPPPITLDEEDRAAVVTAAVPAAAPVTAPQVIAAEGPPAEEPAVEEPLTNAPPPEEPSPSENAVLPGAEAETSAAPVQPAYTILGTLKIPALKVSQNLLEGTGKQMKYGVGHVTSTRLPGQKGNCAVAGHRPYPFRYLDMLQAGDSIVIKMNDITYTYSVYESFEVLPTEVGVLNTVEGEDYTLTIITCTPYMVSSHRLIVRARLTDIEGVPPQEYYGEAEDTASPADVTEPEADASGSSPPEETSVITTDEPAASEAATSGGLMEPDA